jgi:hypothetical protein
VLYVQERDAAGNWSPLDSGVATVDVTPPTVTITSPADGHVTNQASVQVQWTVDGQAQTPVNLNLNEGDNTLTRTATDSAGNQGSDSIRVTRVSGVIFVRASASAGGNGNSWATANRYFQQALARASGGEIWVAQGKYRPIDGIAGIDSMASDTSFVMKTGVAIYGGFSGTEKARALRDWKMNESVLSGERGDTAIGDNMGPIVAGANNATLDGFVVERGYTPPTVGNGVTAMINEFVSPRIANCTFRLNTNRSPELGGVVVNSTSNAIFQSCTFIKNSARYTSAILNLGGAPPCLN